MKSMSATEGKTYEIKPSGVALRGEGSSAGLGDEFNEKRTPTGMVPDGREGNC